MYVPFRIAKDEHSCMGPDSLVVLLFEETEHLISFWHAFYVLSTPMLQRGGYSIDPSLEVCVILLFFFVRCCHNRQGRMNR